MKYLIALVVVIDVIFYNYDMPSFRMCCSFLMAFIIAYCMVDAARKDQGERAIKNLIALSAVLSSIFYNFEMNHLIVYCTFIPVLIFGLCFWKWIQVMGQESGCNCNHQCNCNKNQSPNQPTYTTYTIIDSKTTSSTKL